MRVISWIIFGVVGIAFVGYTMFVYIPGRSIVLSNTDDASLDTSFSFSALGEWFNSLIPSDEVTVAMFGIPGDGYKASTLADAIVVVHMRPDEESVSLISIPRDLWIADATDQFKINDIFYRNKEGTVLNTLEVITGLELDGYVVVDLDTVRKIVDDLGGIDIELPEAAVDWVSGYTLPAGEHHLSGEDAIWLLRNRYHNQGDFFREANQHRVIGAIVKQFSQLSDDDRIALVKRHVFDTNLLSGIRLDFAKFTPMILSTDFSKLSVNSIVLDFSTGLFVVDSIPLSNSSSSISVVMPTEGFERYGAVREYIQSILNP